MNALRISAPAGILVGEGGAPVATLEPELPLELVAALALAPRLLRLVELLERAEASQSAADRASPDSRKVREHFASGDLTAAWAELRRLAADFLEAKTARLGTPAGHGVPCSCPGDCGEDHLGGTCRVLHGQTIRRRVERPGIWVELLSSTEGFRPHVVAQVFETDLGPLCQRCAWLHARLHGGTHA